MNENRVRIIIEVPAAQAVQGVAQVGASLDSLAAKARGIDLGAALGMDASRTAQGIQQVGTALDGLGGKAKAFDLGAALGVDASVVIQPVREVATVLDELGAKAKRAGETAGTAMASTGAETAKLARAGKEAADSIEAAYQKLGLRSGNAIRADIAETIAAYKRLAGSGQTSGRDLEAAYKATQEQVRNLKQELDRVDAGASFRGARQEADRFGAGVGDVSSALSTIRSLASSLGLAVGFREAYQAVKDVLAIIDDYKKTTIGIAATLTDTAKASGDELKLIYQDNLKYAEATYGRVELAAAKFFASGKEMVEAWQILTNKGIRLTSDEDINNLGIIVDKIKLVTQGQSSSLQIAQELRSALSGQARAGDQLAMLLEDRLGPKWKQLLEDQVKNGDAIGFIASQIKGVGVATEDIQNTITSQISTQETIVNQIVRSGLREMYQDIVGIMQQANVFLESQKKIIASILSESYNYLKNVGSIIRHVAMNGPVGGLVSYAADKYNSSNESDTQRQNPSEIKQPVRHVTIGQTINYNDVQQFVKNALTREDSYLKTPVADQSQEIMDRYTKAYEVMQKVVASKKLDNAGLASTGELWIKTLKSEQVELEGVNKKLHAGDEAAANAAIAAERYGEQASAYLDNVTQSLQSMEDNLTGGMNKEADRVDKWFTQAINQAEKAMIGAKGETSAYVQVLQMLRAAWPQMKELATQKDIISALKQQAQILQDIAQATGDPAMAYEAQKKAAEAWCKEKKSLIEHSAADEATKAKELAALQQGYDAKLLDAKSNAYKDVSAVSSQYWDAEKERLTKHLGIVKQNADDETAYRIYAAQQWDDYNKRLLENQAAYAGSFAETLSAKWALAYGSYKSEATRTKETWDQTADGIIKATDGMVDGVAGGLGDLVRSVRNGTASIEDLWENMLSRMLDAFASFLEDLAKSKLKDLAGSLFSGSSSDSGFSLSRLFGGSSSSSSSGGSLSDGIASIRDFGGVIGKETGESFGNYLGTAAATGTSLFVGGENAMAGIFKDGIDMSALGAAAKTVNYVPEAAQASTYLTTGMGATSSLLGTIGSTLGVVGAIGGLVGLAVSLFGEQKEEIKKTASGYNVAYAGGKTTASGIDFYSDGSNVSTGASDPDVTKKISDAFKATSEKLKDFAEALDVGTTAIKDFSIPPMNLTSDQVDTYTRNGSNLMTFQWLNENGLLGVFNELAQDGEVWSDEAGRLAAAYSSGAAKLEAYGYNMEDVAQITDSAIASMQAAATESADNTLQSMVAMGEAAGLTSGQLSTLTDALSTSGSAVEASTGDIKKLMAADWISQVQDRVGGPDALDTILNNLFGNVFDNIAAYAGNLDYYTERATTSISKIGDASITVDTFWASFNAALKDGMSPDTFELWANASSWVANINAVNDALADWNDGMTKLGQSLDQRVAAAQGLDYEAKRAKQLADAEWELAAAREAGYDAAYIARLKTVQDAELAATVAKHQADYQKEVRAASKRYAEAIDDNTTLVALAMDENALELQDMAKTYNWSPGSSGEGLFQALQRAQWAEIVNMIKETGSALAKATTAMKSDLEARRASIAGYDEEAEAIQKVTGYADELSQAYADGLDANMLADLMQVQIDELAKYWSDAMDSMKSDLRDLYKTQSDIMDTLSGNTQSAIQELYALFARYQAGEDDLADSIIDSLKSIANAIDDMVKNIYDTIKEIRTGKDYTTDTADVVSANSKAYFDEQYALAASGDTEAMSSITTYATDYLTALKSSTADESVYKSGVDYVTSMLSNLASSSSSTSSGVTGIAKTVTDKQIADAETALRHAEVASLETTYDTLMAQAVAAFQNTNVAKYIQGLATTGVGWRGLTDLFVDYEGDGLNRLQEIQNGSINWTDYVAWFLNNYGVGTGYVDWEGAMALYGQYAPLPSGVESTYQQALDAREHWQNLKAQYGFALGGVISSPSTSGDNTLVMANGGERVLTPRQNDAFEDLAFGRRSDGLVSALISRVDRLADSVDDFRQANTEENRAANRRLTNIEGQLDDWAVNGSLQVGVKGTVTVAGTVEVAP